MSRKLNEASSKAAGKIALNNLIERFPDLRLGSKSINWATSRERCGTGWKTCPSNSHKNLD